MTDKAEHSRFSTLLRSTPIPTTGTSPVLRRQGVWDRLDLGWKLAIWLLVTLRIGLTLVGVTSIHLQPITVVGGDYMNLVIPGNDVWHQLLSMWQRWDALWYQEIAAHGYQAGTGTAAFYPLYPWLSRLVSFPLAGHVLIAELVVSSVAFLFAMWLLYELTRLDSDHRTATLAVVLTAFFPVGFFLLAPYTESLYLALTLAAFYLARKGRFWAAGLAGLGAALTHEPGAFLVFPLAVQYIRSRRAAGQEQDITLLSTLLPVLGPIIFMAFQRFIVGEHRSLMALQANWGYQILPPWQVLANSWAHIVHTGDFIEVVNLVSLAGFTILAIGVTRRYPLNYALYVWPYMALLFTRQMYLSPLMSVSRLLLVLFPCFIVLALWLARRPWLAAGCVVVSGFIQIMLLEYWVHFGFVA